MTIARSEKTDHMNKQFPILVVDEQWSMRQSVAAALRDMGCQQVLLAANGLEAMHLLQTEQIAAVISDWHMNGIDGLDLLRWVRSESAYFGLPFILVTTQIDRERVRTALAAGASEYLVKPYTAQDLANKITRTLGQECLVKPLDTVKGERVLGLANAAEVEEKIGRSRILIVDDVPVNLAVIAASLKGEYTLEVASSGQQALQIANSAQPPDLILLDVMMPEMDGYEVCQRLKASPDTRHIPIIFLTSHDDAEAVVHGLEAGAVDYIAKPAEPSILKARIRTHLRLKMALSDFTQQNASLAVSAKLREDLERIARNDHKNPLSAIIAGTDQLLTEGGLTEENAKLIHMIQGEARRVFDIANQSLGLYLIDNVMLRSESTHPAGD